MILKEAKGAYLGESIIKKIYLGETLVYTYIISSPPLASEETNVGNLSAENYQEGSTSWGDLTLSSGCEISKDGIEIQDEETYLSSEVSDLSYPMTFEFKGRLDSECYKDQAYNPGMLFGLSPTPDAWGVGITCFATNDYGIIVDTIGAFTIATYKTPNYVHIIFTIDNQGNLTFYLNGINNVWTANSNDAIKDEKRFIYNGQGEGRFVGAINTMRWWNTELSREEIERLYSLDTSEYQQI